MQLAAAALPSEALPELLVCVKDSARPAAQRVFSGFGTRTRIIPFEKARELPGSKVLLLFFRGQEPDAEVSAALRRIRGARCGRLVVYLTHPSLDIAAHFGFLVGQELGESAGFAFDPQDVRQALEKRNGPVHGRASSESPSDIDLAATRKRLSLTQEQMAAALKVTPRTLQNWEKRSGISQVEKKTRDLKEFLHLLDDYVVPGKEAEWLNTPQRAFRGHKPANLLAEGKLRDLIIEFHRMREGQPI